MFLACKLDDGMYRVHDNRQDYNDLGEKTNFAIG